MKNLLFAVAVFIVSQGRAQNALVRFNGTNQYVEVPDQNSIDLSANFTIEGWIYPTGVGSDPTQGGMIVNKENSYEIARFADGTLQYALSANGAGSDWGWTNTGLVAPLNAWSHFALVKSGTNITFYLNAAASASSSSNPATLTANTQNLRFADRTNSSQYFNGSMDEIRLWNTARSLAQIKTNMFNSTLLNNASGMVAYYRMNENGGSTTANSCTNSTGIDGVLVNGPSWLASPVQFGVNSLSFDGLDDQVVITHDNSLDITNAITIEAWIYASKNSGIQNVVSKSSSTVNNGYIFPRTDNGWTSVSCFLFIGGGWNILSAPYPSLNAWHHLACTYDGANEKLYIDGTLANSQALSGTIAINANPLALGNQTGFSEFFGGQADEIRIWNIARTQAQIQANMNTEIDPLTQTGLVSYYTFNQGIANGTNTGLMTLIDQTAKNNGTLSGFGSSGTTSNFVSQFSGLVALPVSWAGFTAQQQDNRILLNWSTASEQNAKDFAVQHSINGIAWDELGRQPAAGNSSSLRQYSFVHNNPATGINYYRILQEDLDGRIGYSKTIKLFYSNHGPQIMVYPNPVKGGMVKLQLRQPSTVTVYNNSGKLIVSKQLPAGTQQLNLANLPPGIYQLKTAKQTISVVLQ